MKRRPVDPNLYRDTDDDDTRASEARDEARQVTAELRRGSSREDHTTNRTPDPWRLATRR